MKSVLNRVSRHLWRLCVFLALATMLSHTAASLDAVPPISSLVVDQAGVLSEADQSALRDRLGRIQAAGRGQVAILIANGIHGEALADYSLRVAEAWQLGRAGRDDGLLILVVPSLNAARIEIGYGLEGAIPDARASQWLDELLSALKGKKLMSGLGQLLDHVEAALPKPDADTDADAAVQGDLLDRHPEWKLPFVLAVFSPLALFPLVAGRWGSVIAAPLFGGFIGGAVWALQQSPAAGLGAAVVACALALLWGLNWSEDAQLGHWQRAAKVFGNVVAVTFFFCVVTLFVGVGLSVAEVKQVWTAPMFAGLLAVGLGVFLFPGAPARYLMVVLRSAMHFVFVLAATYVGLQPIIDDPTRIAFGVAGAVTACIALGLYFDSRARGADGAHGTAATCVAAILFGLALLVTLPLALLALIMAVVGDDVHLRLTQAAAGGVSLVGGLALAARYGLIAAVKVGLGGRFGGGGAGRGD
jgi:uncharacterized protein